MTQTLERPPEVESRTGTELLDERQVTVKEPMRPTAPPPPEPTRFVRWLAWIVVSIAVLGTAAVIWWAIDNPFEAEPVTPAIESIDPRESPEILRAGVPLMAPAIDMIDPRESPEVLRGIWGAGSVGVDLVSLQSLEQLQSMPTQGIDPYSLESLELLRSMPAMAAAIESIDPHESPEVLRSQVYTVDIDSIDPHQSPEILRSQ